MMTVDEFRRVALSFQGASESAHMDHPDFRTSGKIFASLGYPEEGWGMVKLTPEQQQALVKQEPAVFVPCNGAWGRGGATNVRLASARKSKVRSALKAAWQNITASVGKKSRR
jgi:hypothetical protein